MFQIYTYLYKNKNIKEKEQNYISNGILDYTTAVVYTYSVFKKKNVLIPVW